MICLYLLYKSTVLQITYTIHINQNITGISLIIFISFFLMSHQWQYIIPLLIHMYRFQAKQRNNIFPAQSFHEPVKLTFQCFPIYTHNFGWEWGWCGMTRDNTTNTQKTATQNWVNFLCWTCHRLIPTTKLHLLVKNIIHYRCRNLVKETAADRYMLCGLLCLGFFVIQEKIAFKHTEQFQMLLDTEASLPEMNTNTQRISVVS